MLPRTSGVPPRLLRGKRVLLLRFRGENVWKERVLQDGFCKLKINLPANDNSFPPVILSENLEKRIDGETKNSYDSFLREKISSRGNSSLSVRRGIPLFFSPPRSKDRSGMQKRGNEVEITFYAKDVIA